MFSRVSIKNFKSVRDLQFEAKRVNVFIGEPNTGKSNLLEALSLLSQGVQTPEVFREFFRFRSMADLYYDQQVADAIRVETDKHSCSLEFIQGSFRFTLRNLGKDVGSIVIGQSGEHHSSIDLPEDIRCYRFKNLTRFPRQEYGPLASPYGENLAALIYTNKELRKKVSDLFRVRNFRLEIKPVEMELLIAKSVDDELYSFPYAAISETLRRIVFFIAVLETNQNTTLILDEPEANTFPFYTTYLAERMALDDSNQFFITTHNPYVLGSIVGKTPVKNLSVFVTTMENYETKVKLVAAEGLSKILDYGPDAFLNLERIVEA